MLFPQQEVSATFYNYYYLYCRHHYYYHFIEFIFCRTLHFGTPTDFEKECYTRVLQGLIRLATATFPKGTSGKRLDCLARLPLWEAGLDYDHGTGHGVGSVLGVHEDLVTFSSKAEYETEIQVGRARNSVTFSETPSCTCPFTSLHSVYIRRTWS